MKRILGFFVMFVLLASVVVTAQEHNSLRDVVERNAYGDNWFISLGGNANLLLAEQDRMAPSLGERFKFGGSFTLGKWFNPDFGARIQVVGGGLRGFNYAAHINPGYYTGPGGHSDYPMGGPVRGSSKYKVVTSKDGKAGFWQDFNYATATIDLMGNLTNLMRGRYAEGNLIDVIPFAGIGVITAFSNDLTTPNWYQAVAKIGFRVNCNINNNFSIYLEPQANVTDPEFDGYKGTAIGDGILNLSLGVQYSFNKKFTSLSTIVQLSADEIDRLNKKINDNRYLIENHQDILERQQDLLDRLEKCCEENKKEVVTQVIDNNGCLPDYIRFGLDSYKIEPQEQRKIADVADYLKKNTNSKLLMIGYADRKTGNPRYNFNLSQKRVDAVAAELKRLGINANRITVEWKGDKEQPFPQNEWNRVVVMVERK
jgi:outer membrane protein OmpA-like peptidoglycan-associated protein